MNPKITISVDAKNKAIATLTGMVTVGSKVDIEISGLPDSIPNWREIDPYTGKSLRFRVVDCLGNDLVRYPLVKKDDETDGDTWDVDEDGVYANSDGCEVDFNTHKLRHAFNQVPFNEYMELGIILDSFVDSAEYAIGKIKVRQWSSASCDTPTVLPDWREILHGLKIDLESVNQSKAAAAASATQSATSATNAATSESSASASESSAADYAAAANEAKEDAVEAMLKYPYIDEFGHWRVWSIVAGEWVDNGEAVAHFDDTVTQTSSNGVKSSGIWTWVKSLLPDWLTKNYAEPATVASVSAEESRAKGVEQDLRRHVENLGSSKADKTTTYTKTETDAAIVANVENSVTSTSTTKALSANMGKELQAQIQNLKQRGRYLSIWNCATGLAKTEPTVNPYEYKAGDYFIVGTVAEEGDDNYRPSGTEYDKTVPSTTVETGSPIVNDTYYYDGTSWSLLHTEQPEISWGSIPDKPSTFPPSSHTHAQSDVTGLADTLAAKVDGDSFQLPLKHESASPSVSGTATLTTDQCEFRITDMTGSVPQRPFRVDPMTFVMTDVETYGGEPCILLKDGSGDWNGYGWCSGRFSKASGWYVVESGMPVGDFIDISEIEFPLDTVFSFNYSQSETWTFRVNWTVSATEEKTSVITDSAPTAGSGNLLTSGAIKTALDTKLPRADVINPVIATTTGKAADALATKNALSGKLDKVGDANYGTKVFWDSDGMTLKVKGNMRVNPDGDFAGLYVPQAQNTDDDEVWNIGQIRGEIGDYSWDWSAINNTPTTVDGYGITDASKTSDFSTSSPASYVTNFVQKLVTILAPNFSESTSYAVGNFCTRMDGTTLKLYQCTVAHTGAWNAAHFAVRDVSALFSTADSSDDPQPSGLLNNAVLDKAIVKVASTVSPTDVAKSGAVAAAFSTSKTYAVDELVMHDGLLYRCTTAVTTAGAWDSTKWTAVAATDSDTAFLKDSQGHLVIKETAGQKNTLYVDAYRMVSLTTAGTKALKDASVNDCGTIAANDVLTLPPAISGYCRDLIVILQTPATLPTFTFPLVANDLEPWSDALPTWAASTIYRITMSETRSGKWEIHTASKGVTA